MAGKVLIIQWRGSAYDSLAGLLELVAHNLRAQGMNIVWFTADESDWPPRLLDVLRQGGFTFALTMSGIGADLVADGRPLWDLVQVPLFNWSCDHPCYFPTRHVIRSQFLLHGYVFPDHARYNTEHLHPNGIAYAVHLGMPGRALMWQDAPLPLADRNGRITFSKTGADTNTIEASWKKHGLATQAILFAGAEALFQRHTADFLPILQSIAASHGLLLESNNKLTLYLLSQLDVYTRFRRANVAMRALLDYPVDVFGTGWDHLPWADARAVLQGPITWRDNMQRLPRYLGCLSLNPLIAESFHDRVFFALAAGVVPLSDVNAFARQHTPGLVPYMFDCFPEQICQAADALLGDPVEALTRVEAAYRGLTPAFSLKQSVLRILEFVSMRGANVQF